MDRFELSHKKQNIIRKTRDSPCQKCGGKTGCETCLSVNVCKYAPLPDCVEGCHFKQQKKEMIEK
jgi:hypothetical protein